MTTPDWAAFRDRDPLLIPRAGESNEQAATRYLTDYLGSCLVQGHGEGLYRVKAGTGISCMEAYGHTVEAALWEAVNALHARARFTGNPPRALP